MTMDTTTETAVLKTSQKRHIDIFDTEISIRPDLANATSPLKKMSDSISQKSELKRDSIISSQKVHFKEFQIDGINSYGISNDKYRRNSTMDSRDDSLKSNVQKPINLHVRLTVFYRSKHVTTKVKHRVLAYEIIPYVKGK